MGALHFLLYEGSEAENQLPLIRPDSMPPMFSSCLNLFSGISTLAVIAPSCPDGWTSYNDHCFLYVPTTMTWANAEVIRMVWILAYSSIWCRCMT